MFVLILQSALLLAIAFILGCILGCLLRTWFGGDAAVEAPKASLATAAASVAGAGAAATLAKPAATTTPAPAQSPAPETVPAPVKAPEPVKPAEPVALEQRAPVKAAPATKPAAKKPAPKKPAARKPAAKKPVATKAPAKVDDLKLIKGIGRQNEARLNALGVLRFADIAGWNAQDAADWGERLAFPGRIEREDWIGQAKVLAAGGSTPFASRVRRGGVGTSVGKGDVGDLGKKPRLLTKARAAGPDNLTLIDGVGNALEKRLFGIGIYHFDQIAKLSADEAKWVGIAVGFPGRLERENWVEEARILGEGGMTEHAKRVEEGKIATSRVSTNAEKKKT